MKNLFAIAICAALLGTAPAFAQNQQTTVGQDLKNAGKDVGRAGKKVGNKTAKVASKGASKVVDKTYQDKVGPDGQTIYIDKHSKYYWVDDKGHHVYVSQSELRDK